MTPELKEKIDIDNRRKERSNIEKSMEVDSKDSVESHLDYIDLPEEINLDQKKKSIQ